MGILFYLALAYILCSIPFGLVFVYLVKGEDIRKFGSGNIGATNVFRFGGAPVGILTLFFDALKGYLPVVLVMKAYPEQPLYHVMVAIVGILGHSYSIFLKFRGGKGVATGLGVCLALLPLQVALAAVVFAALFLTSGYVSLGSVGAALSLPLISLLTGVPSLYLLFTIAAAALVIIRHQENIRRLLLGTETKILWNKDRKKN